MSSHRSRKLRQDKYQKNTPRRIIHKPQKNKDKEKILKEARRQKYLTYREIGIRIALNFSSEAVQARREWGEIFKVLKEKKKTHHLFQFYPTK